MPSRYRRFHLCFLVVLFLCSFTFCLGLNYVPFTVQAKSAEVALAQSPTPSQLVQQGIEQYRAGDVLSAIASWQTANTAYQNPNNLANAAIVREKLAVAYQQIGQFENAIALSTEATSNYRSLGDLVKVERLLVEQAQTYSRWGQNKSAIALLCGAAETDENCLQSQGSALHLARKFGDFQGEAAALGSLGEAYRLRGKQDKAVKILEDSLKIIQR